MAESTVGLIAAIVAGVLLLWLAVYGIGSFVAGAKLMFARAADRGGCAGIKLMLALWIFAFPVMAVLALVVGICTPSKG